MVLKQLKKGFHNDGTKKGSRITVIKQFEKRFGTSNYQFDKSLLRAKNEKSNWVNERQIRWKNKSLLS